MNPRLSAAAKTRKIFEAQLSISRSNASLIDTENHVVRMTIRDKQSRKNVMYIEIEMDAYGNAVSGLSEQPIFCEITPSNIDLIGIKK